MVVEHRFSALKIILSYLSQVAGNLNGIFLKSHLAQYTTFKERFYPKYTKYPRVNDGASSVHMTKHLSDV